MRKIKVLYLAHYAPDQNEIFPEHDSLNKVYAAYHKDIYYILKNEFPTLISSDNPAIVLNLPLGVNYIFSLYNRMPFKNSEVFVSSVAEYRGVAYLGGTPNIRALAEDKHLGKMMAKHAGVPTPKWEIYSKGRDIEKPYFPGPYFVKPRFGAASKHITEDSICSNWYQAQEQIQYLLDIKEDAILEEYINGIYYTSPVLKNYGNPKALPCIEQRSELAGNVVTYQQKRKFVGGLTRTPCVNDELNNKLQNYSLTMFDLVQPLDYTRFDYLVTSEGHVHFLEFNVCCNLGRYSTISQAAVEIGCEYETLVLNILYSSLYRTGLSDSILYKL